MSRLLLHFTPPSVSKHSTTDTASINPRIRIVAGPGTGKSFAMKRRVACLLEEGVVAAEDLHRELIGMSVPGCDSLNGVTLHSLSLKMLLMRNHVLEATGRTARPLNEFEVLCGHGDFLRRLERIPTK